MRHNYPFGNFFRWKCTTWGFYPWRMNSEEKRRLIQRINENAGAVLVRHPVDLQIWKTVGPSVQHSAYNDISTLAKALEESPEAISCLLLRCEERYLEHDVIEYLLRRSERGIVRFDELPLLSKNFRIRKIWGDRFGFFLEGF